MPHGCGGATLAQAYLLARAGRAPYLETSNAVEWSTQEIWDVPYFYAVGAIAYLTPRRTDASASS